MSANKSTYLSIKIPRDAKIDDFLKDILVNKIDVLKKKMILINKEDDDGVTGDGTFAEIGEDTFVEIIRK
jgi:hypothetical protein